MGASIGHTHIHTHLTHTHTLCMVLNHSLHLFLSTGSVRNPLISFTASHAAIVFTKSIFTCTTPLEKLSIDDDDDSDDGGFVDTDSV